MAKRTYKDKMPYDRKDVKFWVPIELLEKLDVLCKERNISKTTIFCQLLARLTREVTLSEEKLAAIEEEKKRRAEQGFYVPRDQAFGLTDYMNNEML